MTAHLSRVSSGDAETTLRTSLPVRCLRLHLSNAGSVGWIPGQLTCLLGKKPKHFAEVVTNSIKTLKMVHTGEKQRIFDLKKKNKHCSGVGWWQCLGRSPSSVQFSRSVASDSLRPHESQHARPPCPSPTPGVHSDSRPSSQ